MFASAGLDAAGADDELPPSLSWAFWFSKGTGDSPGCSGLLPNVSQAWCGTRVAVHYVASE